MMMNNNTETSHSNAVMTTTNEDVICDDEIIDADSVWVTSIERHYSSTSASEWTSSSPNNITTTTTTTITPTTTMPHYSTNEMNNSNDRDGDYDIEQPTSSSSVPTKLSETRHHQHGLTSSVSPSSSPRYHRRNCASMITTILWLKKKIVTRYMELVWIMLALILARVYPILGTQYILPSITCEWIAVILHFGLLGLTMETDEFVTCFQQQWRFTIFVQCFNFGIVSAFSYLVSGGIISMGEVLAYPYLAIGLIIAASFPMGITSVMKLTKEFTTYGIDDTVARFQTNWGTLLSIPLSPLLIFLYVSSISTGLMDNDILKLYVKFPLRVIFPFCVGQALRYTVKHPTTILQILQKIQLYNVIFMIYILASISFASNILQINGMTMAIDIFVIAGIQLALFVILSGLAWILLGSLSGILLPSNNNVAHVMVTGLFGCCHKSLSVGIPLLVVIFGLDTPQLGLYMSPLLIWYTIQVLVGNLCVSPLKRFVNRSSNRELEAIKAGGAKKPHSCNESESTFEDEEIGIPTPTNYCQQENPPSTIEDVRETNAHEAIDDGDEFADKLMFNYINQRNSIEEHSGAVDGGYDDGFNEFIDDEINSWMSEMAYSDIVFDQGAAIDSKDDMVASVSSDESTYLDDDEGEDEVGLFLDEKMKRTGSSPTQNKTVLNSTSTMIPSSNELRSSSGLNPSGVLSGQHDSFHERSNRPTRATYGPGPDLSEEGKPTLAEI